MKTHKTDIRVRYEETDRMGVVYYANYFVWLEIARTEFFRSLGLPYTELEKEGLRLMVKDAQCNYKAPVTYDDMVIVETRIDDARNASLHFSYNVYRDKALVATGKTSHVFTDKNGRPTRIPDKVKKALSA